MIAARILPKILILVTLFVAGYGFDSWAGEEEFVAWESAPAAAPESAFCSTPPANTRPDRALDLFRKFGSVGLSLLLTILGGVMLRLGGGRGIRPAVLLVSLAVLGFAMGACPCLIKGVQTPLAWLGGDPHLHWIPMAGALALIPLTILLGPTFCGWACPLGALQEFLHRRSTRSLPPTPHAGAALKWIRRGAALALATWLLATGHIFWDRVDPFRAIFNLRAPTAATLAAVLVLLGVSLYVYRPFCRALCPLGLLLGLVARLPFAARSRAGSGCSRCRRCVRVCDMGAMDSQGRVDPELCIGCGQCIEVCGANALVWRNRKGKTK